MQSQFEKTVTRVLIRWVDGVSKRPGLVIALIAAATVGLGGYAALNLGVNSDNVRLIGENLPSRKNHEAFAAIFPNLENALLVVIDGETPEITRMAADQLWHALREQTDRYRTVYLPGGGEFFEQHGLLYMGIDDLYEFGDAMATIQPIIAELERDSSVANLASLVQEGLARARENPSEIDWATVLDQISQATISLYREYPLSVSWESLFLKGSSVDVITRRVIIVDPILDFDSLLAAGRAMSSIQDTASELNLSAERGVRVRVTGNPALNYEEMMNIAWDIAVAGVFCFLLVCGVLFRALRSLPLVIAAVSALLVGLVWSAGYAAIAIGHLNLVSMAFGVLFIGLGVDFAIHLCMAYGNAIRSGQTAAEALRTSVEDVGSSLVICSITTAMGFYVFVPTDYRGIAELGLIAGTGMFIILFQTLTLIPALTSSWLSVNPESLSKEFRFRQGTSRVLARHPAAIACTALAAGLLALFAIPEARFDPNVIAMRDPTTESVQAFDDLLQESGMASPWYVNTVAKDLAAAKEVSALMRALPSVSESITLADYVPRDQDEKLEILEEVAYFLESPGSHVVEPEAASIEEQLQALKDLRAFLRDEATSDRESGFGKSVNELELHLGRFLDDIDRTGEVEAGIAKLESVLLAGLPDQIARLRSGLSPERVTIDGLPEELKGRMLAADGRARVQSFPVGNLGEEEAFDQFANEVRSVDPFATGVSINLIEFGRAIKSSFQQALISAVLATIVILWVLWRQAALVSMAIAPILLSSVLTVATMVILDLPFNFGNVIVIPLLMGIGVDSGIHLVHRSLNPSTTHAVLESTTARAVFYSAITTVVSFGSLAFSSHRGLSNMGIVLTAGMLLTILANLVVLPALIQLRKPKL